MGLGSWPWASSARAGQVLYLEGRNKEDLHRCFLSRRYLHNPEFVISSEIPGCLRDFDQKKKKKAILWPCLMLYCLE